jgi:hypothetical protein
VHTLDVARAADAIEQGRWSPEPVMAADLPFRFGYVQRPATVNDATPE